MEILLSTLNDTERFGATLARLLARSGAPNALFFKGGLGAGKTTLIRALVAALPGGDTAEAASPSFNLCNLYRTTPPVAHFDLYRQENGMADESLLDFLDDGRHVVVVEWAERLPAHVLPPARIECVLAAARDGMARSVKCIAFGAAAEALLDALSGGNM